MLNIYNVGKCIHRFFVSIGINLLMFKNIFFLKRYLVDLVEFKKRGGKINYYWPIFADNIKKSGDISGDYFHQDLLVASNIFKSNPTKHLDIASRIDGFVAHVASFRKIEIADIRPQISNLHENITYKFLDLTNITDDYLNYTDSLSCLHSIEHIGLGRYGDKLDPTGYKLAINNLIKILKPGGTLYLSFPLSKKTRVFFNAHRTLDPKIILLWSDKLCFKNFDHIDMAGNLHKNISESEFFNLNDGCGILTVKKK